MIESVRSADATMTIEINTNKATYRETFTWGEEESFAEFLERIQDWYAAIREGLE